MDYKKAKAELKVAKAQLKRAARNSLAAMKHGTKKQQEFCADRLLKAGMKLNAAKEQLAQYPRPPITRKVKGIALGIGIAVGIGIALILSGGDESVGDDSPIQDQV